MDRDRRESFNDRIHEVPLPDSRAIPGFAQIQGYAQVQSQVHQGNALYRAERYGEALDMYSKSISDGILIERERFAEEEGIPRPSEFFTPQVKMSLFMNVAACLSKLRRLDEAEVAAEQAVALQPRDAQAHGRHGAVLQLRGDILGSIRAFATATSLVQSSRQTNERGQVMFITLFSAQIIAFLPVDREIRDSLSNTASSNPRSYLELKQYGFQLSECLNAKSHDNLRLIAKLQLVRILSEQRMLKEGLCIIYHIAHMVIDVHNYQTFQKIFDFTSESDDSASDSSTDWVEVTLLPEVKELYRKVVGCSYEDGHPHDIMLCFFRCSLHRLKEVLSLTGEGAIDSSRDDIVFEAQSEDDALSAEDFVRLVNEDGNRMYRWYLSKNTICLPKFHKMVVHLIRCSSEVSELECLCDIVKGIFDCCATDFPALFRYISIVEVTSPEENTTSDPVPASQRTSAEMETFLVNWMTEAGWPQGLSSLVEKTAKLKIDFSLESLPDDNGLGQLKRS